MILKLPWAPYGKTQKMCPRPSYFVQTGAQQIAVCFKTEVFIPRNPIYCQNDNTEQTNRFIHKPSVHSSDMAIFYVKRNFHKTKMLHVLARRFVTGMPSAGSFARIASLSFSSNPSNNIKNWRYHPSKLRHMSSDTSKEGSKKDPNKGLDFDPYLKHRINFENAKAALEKAVKPGMTDSQIRDEVNKAYDAHIPPVPHWSVSRYTDTNNLKILKLDCIILKPSPAGNRKRVRRERAVGEPRKSRSRAKEDAGGARTSPSLHPKNRCPWSSLCHRFGISQHWPQPSAALNRLSAGKRKTSVARVWVTHGDGTVIVNKKHMVLPSLPFVLIRHARSPNPAAAAAGGLLPPHDAARGDLPAPSGRRCRGSNGDAHAAARHGIQGAPM